MVPASTGHLCFVLLWENINYRDFNWIRGWFVVTLRGRGCEKTACASSFQPWEAASEFILALCITAAGEGLSALLCLISPLERLELSHQLAVERNSGLWRAPLGVRGREGGAHPSHGLKSHSECIRREHKVGFNSCCLLEILLFKTIFPLK